LDVGGQAVTTGTRDEIGDHTVDHVGGSADLRFGGRVLILAAGARSSLGSATA
jgi:hypothetical protein